MHHNFLNILIRSLYQEPHLFQLLSFLKFHKIFFFLPQIFWKHLQQYLNEQIVLLFLFEIPFQIFHYPANTYLTYNILKQMPGKIYKSPIFDD